jgi:hypothetical protein
MINNAVEMLKKNIDADYSSVISVVSQEKRRVVPKEAKIKR